MNQYLGDPRLAGVAVLMQQDEARKLHKTYEPIRDAYNHALVEYKAKVDEFEALEKRISELRGRLVTSVGDIEQFGAIAKGHRNQPFEFGVWLESAVKARIVKTKTPTSARIASTLLMLVNVRREAKAAADGAFAGVPEIQPHLALSAFKQLDANVAHQQAAQALVDRETTNTAEGAKVFGLPPATFKRFSAA